jgi:hypothetical protein
MGMPLRSVTSPESGSRPHKALIGRHFAHQRSHIPFDLSFAFVTLNKWIWFSGKPPRYRAVEVFMLMSGVFELAFTQGGLHFSAAANPSVDVRPFNRHCSGNAITSCGSCWIVDQNLEL